MQPPLYKGRRPKCVAGKYLLYEKVGEGAWAKVRRCLVLPELTIVACKIYYWCVVDKKLKGGYERIQNEFKLVSAIQHPNIIQYFDICSDEDKVYVLMEYCEGGSVESLLSNDKDLNLDTIRVIMWHLFQSLHHLYTLHISHHDIKPGNLLIKNSTDKPSDRIIKLADFTVAEQLQKDNISHSSFGTPAYQAPEQLQTDQDSEFKYDGCKADMWSAGITLYQLCHRGRLPWKGDTVYAVMREIAAGVGEFDYGDGSLGSLMRGLLQRDPKERLTAKEALDHAFFERSSPKTGCRLV